MIGIDLDLSSSVSPPDVRNVSDLPQARRQMSGLHPAIALFALALLALCPSLSQSQTKPDKDYLVYVVSEAADKIALIRAGVDFYKTEPAK